WYCLLNAFKLSLSSFARLFREILEFQSHIWSRILPRTKPIHGLFEGQAEAGRLRNRRSHRIRRGVASPSRCDGTVFVSVDAFLGLERRLLNTTKTKAGDWY